LYNNNARLSPPVGYGRRREEEETTNRITEPQNSGSYLQGRYWGDVPHWVSRCI